MQRMQTNGWRRWMIPGGLIGAAVVFWGLAMVHQARRSGGMTPVSERRAMPDLAMTRLDGGVWRMDEHRGDVVVVNYWASWCGPCWEETPGLVRLSREMGGKGVTVVGVAMDEGGRDKVQRFVDRFGVNYPVLLPVEFSQMAYGMDGLPTTILVDREGRVAKTYVGAVREAGLRADMSALLQEAR